MFAKRLASALVSIALITAPAQAQTNQPSGPSAPAAGQTNMGNWMTQVEPGQWRASTLEGLDVYNTDNEKIGDISELLVDGSGKIQAVLIGVGGFLGIGERAVAIPFDQIKFVNEPRATAANTGGTGLAGTSPSGGTVGSPTMTGTAAVPANPGAPANPNMATNNANAASPNAPTTTGAAPASQNEAKSSAPDHAVLTMTMTKEQVQAAPEFRYAR
jgi:sporulation protein YlmC with PRC-barrel domain